MLECPSCGRQHRAGTLFCSECGVYLPAGGPLRTEPLPTDDLPTSRANPWAIDAGEMENTEKPAELHIRVVQSGRHVRLPVVPMIVMGRLDATYGIYPDLDLTPDGGLDGGVSRRHAKILRKEMSFLLEDLDSGNGTFLNGQRLTPFLPHPLQRGDKLQLGSVQLRVDFD